MNLSLPRNCYIEAAEIQIGKGISFGENISIRIRKKFSLGDFSRIGNNVSITGEQVEIGDHFFHTNGLVIGGGGSQFPQAILRVGDRCVMHNNYINLCRPILIGDDVGLSPDVQIITHGFWKSILEGFPVHYGSVELESGVIIGQRSMILPGVRIAKDCVIGAQSVVSESLTTERSVYAGSPARFIRSLTIPGEAEQRVLLNNLIRDYREFITSYYPAPEIRIDFPYLSIEGFTMNVLNGESSGIETKATDDLRDFLRRYGIRIYTERPFGAII